MELLARAIFPVTLVAAVATAAACTGTIGDNELGPRARATPAADSGSSPPPALVGADGLNVARAGLRRLSQAELAATIEDVMGVAPPRDLIMQMPTEALTPFDNDSTSQSVSDKLISSLSAIAENMAERVGADAKLKAAVMPCTPAAPGDEACFRTVVKSLGRRLLRRPLIDDETNGYVAALVPLSVAANDFSVGVGRLVSALLQDVEFVYRIESGEPVANLPGWTRLTDAAIATRMAFLLWGRGPDNALLDKAEAGQLRDPAARRAVAEAMLAHPRAKVQVNRLHAQWLGYEGALPDSQRIPADIQGRLRTEIDALVERVVFDRNVSWFDLFKAEDAFVDDALAKHYGDVPAPGSTTPKWTAYGPGSHRRGILSTGAFFSVESTFADTSPTKRGKMVRERLLCSPIPPPPPNLKVDVDSLPKRDCKVDRYAMSRIPECATCHKKMDDIGFGLEQFDTQGRLRLHDDASTTCTLDGRGMYLQGSNEKVFTGPVGLQDMLLTDPSFDNCFMSRVFQFTQGRPADAEDSASLDALTGDFRKSDRRLKELLVSIVTAESFAVRQEVNPL